VWFSAESMTSCTVPTFWASWLGKCDVLHGWRESVDSTNVGTTVGISPCTRNALPDITEYPLYKWIHVDFSTYHVKCGCFIVMKNLIQDSVEMLSKFHPFFPKGDSENSDRIKNRNNYTRHLFWHVINVFILPTEYISVLLRAILIINKDFYSKQRLKFVIETHCVFCTL
jgi:hypothetical protein